MSCHGSQQPVIDLTWNLFQASTRHALFCHLKRHYSIAYATYAWPCKLHEHGAYLQRLVVPTQTWQKTTISTVGHDKRICTNLIRKHV